MTAPRSAVKRRLVSWASAVAERLAAEGSPRDAAAMAKDALDSEVPLVIGLRLSREAAIEEHALDTWGDLGVVLARLLALLAWSPSSAARLSERPSRRGKRPRILKAP